MSDDDAALRFYPWVRRGAAAYLTTADAASASARASIPATITFNDAAANLTATTTLDLVGPGDVVGFDARVISRRSPPEHTFDAEPNYFPAIEFDQADLPWRYTPCSEDATARVRPWLCLLAFTEDELEPFVPTSADRPLQSVTVKAATAMPPPDQTWAWAHVQVSGDDDLSLLEVATQAPHRCLARLLCPRRLAPRTKYWVLLVPAFEVGRLAGLKQPQPAAAPDPLASAWSGTTLSAPLELPIYHRWTFTTGFDGDFEALVRRLTPAPLPATVGTRGLDVAQPGAGLPAPTVEPLPLGGALRPPGLSAPTAIDPDFTTGLASLLNIPAEVRAAGGTPVVAPPLYGAWHAGRERLAADAPSWFAAVNTALDTRVAAASGTAVVQQKQEDLMAAAWDQVAGIREANQQLRAAQVARAVGERLYQRHVVAADDTAALTLTATVHGHIRGAVRTVRGTVDRSPPRHALLASGLRRLGRPLGPVGRRQARPDLVVPSALERVNAGELEALAATPPPLAPSVPTVTWFEGVTKTPYPTGKDVDAAPIAEKVYAWDPVDGDAPDKWDQGDQGDSPSMAAFRAAASALLGREFAPGAGQTLTPLDVPALRAVVQAAVDPRTTIAEAFGVRMVPAAGFSWTPPDPLEPVMAHPDFPQAMFRPLAAMSPDWILPGLFDVPADRVTLAKTNQAFIEAYMVGLNHELGRELLWREYPSDQRGSYFRQFWEPAGESTLPPESAKDITPVHGWGLTTLGAHCPRPGAGDELVLVVRGEALRRYPGTLVYAQRAAVTAGGLGLASDAQQRRPVFTARIDPDVALFGFALTEAEARGDAAAGIPGWFFVFEEQPGDPRFGLDTGATEPPSALDDLAWEHLAVPPGDVTSIAYIDLAVPRSEIAALEVPTGPAWHAILVSPSVRVARGADQAVITHQRPVRVALYGADLLP
ncbi:MAG: hypothetical protein IPL61_30155 [Myxococcales bacterium]|nr:hypothetical protein [Myxococcales bacterium]